MAKQGIDNNRAKSTGEKIKRTRMCRNMTQEELAEKVEISSVYLRRIESGKSFGSIETIIKICNTLEVTPTFLLTDLLEIQDAALNEMIALNISKLSKADKEIIMRLISYMLLR